MKVEATGAGRRSSRPPSAPPSWALGHVWDYDDVFIAPRYGFAGAEDYYERCRPTRFMAGIRVPTLVLAALDDPWIPGALYAAMIGVQPSLTPLLPESRRPCRLPRHAADGSPGATWPSRGSSNMAEA